MSQDQAHTHDDHEHSQLELNLARALGSAQAHIEMLSVSEHILRKAVLQLLPVTGDSVIVDVTEVNMDDGQGGQATMIKIFRDGDVLDIKLGAY